jgi:hypothetical protein
LPFLAFFEIFGLCWIKSPLYDKNYNKVIVFNVMIDKFINLSYNDIVYHKVKLYYIDTGYPPLPPPQAPGGG